MEDQLFSWEQCDKIDTGGFTFYNVVLKVPIGNYNRYMSFTTANVDFQRGCLELYQNDTLVGKFRLNLSVSYWTE